MTLHFKTSFILAIFILVNASILAQTKYDSSYFTKDWGGARTKLSDKGFDFHMEYTGGVFQNVSGGIKEGAAYNGLLNTGLIIDLEKLAGWSGLSFHVNTLWIHGKDGSGEFIGDICGHNNIYHDKTFRLFTSYFQKTFWQDKATF